MLIYLEGNESFLAKEAIEKLRAKYLEKNTGGVELVDIDVAEGKINWADLQAVPLFSQARLVFLRHLWQLPLPEQESLASFLQNIPGTTVVVAWEGIKVLPKNSRLQKVLQNAQKKIDVSLPTGAGLKKYLAARAKHHQLEIDNQLEQLLIKDFGNDLWALENELAVLALGGRVNASAKQAVEPFALYRQVSRGNWARVKELLVSEFRAGSPIELLIGSIASALRDKPASHERRAATEVLVDIDAGLKTGLLDEAAAVAMLEVDLPKGRQNRVEWEKLWEERLGG